MDARPDLQLLAEVQGEKRFRYWRHGDSVMGGVWLYRDTAPVDGQTLDRYMPSWCGDAEIKWHLSVAKQHSDVLFREFYKEQAGILNEALEKLMGAGGDPIESSDSPSVVAVWKRQLPVAIGAADATSMHMMLVYSANDPKIPRLFFHAEHALHALIAVARRLDWSPLGVDPTVLNA